MADVWPRLVRIAKADAATAQAELPPAPGEDQSGVPNMGSLGGGAREGGREASEDIVPPQLAEACPEGLVPVMHNGQPIIDAHGKPVCRAKRQDAVKGELTNLGAAKLLVKDSRFGLRLGYARLDRSTTSRSKCGNRSALRQNFGVGRRPAAQHARLRQRRIRRRGRNPPAPARLRHLFRLRAHPPLP